MNSWLISEICALEKCWQLVSDRNYVAHVNKCFWGVHLGSMSRLILSESVICLESRDSVPWAENLFVNWIILRNVLKQGLSKALKNISALGPPRKPNSALKPCVRVHRKWLKGTSEAITSFIFCRTFLVVELKWFGAKLAFTILLKILFPESHFLLKFNKFCVQSQIDWMTE